MAQKALITGISGQDGSYLAELLLSKNYEVHGTVLRTELDDPRRSLWRIYSILDRVTLHPVSIESFPSIFRLIERVQPDECYHLAALSFVSYSLDDEFAIFNTNLNGTHYMISTLKELAPRCRFLFAASAEVFGLAQSTPQNEQTPFHPRSPYGITKVAGYHLTRYYRENHKLYACSAILYNHESPRRGYEFVTRKITHGAAQIKLGLIKTLPMGNLDAIRDWGFAGDYVEAEWRMLQQEQPNDYVIASGQGHSVRELCELAFSQLGLDYHDYVVFDQRFYKPTETIPLVGDATRARQELGWSPRVSFEEMVKMMVEVDMAELQGKI